MAVSKVMNSAELTELSDLYCFWCGTERDIGGYLVYVRLGCTCIIVGTSAIRASHVVSAHVHVGMTHVICVYYSAAEEVGQGQKVKQL